MKVKIASDETDVVTTIGIQQGDVTSPALPQLVCTPPENQSLPTEENGLQTSINLPLVVVLVGRLSRFTIGYWKYEPRKP